MDNSWTLRVEDFGKIESAEISVSPLTLFVGDNNSGKSYLLSLLYGLMKADYALSDLCEDSPEYQECAAWTKAAIEEGKRTGDIERPFDDDAYDLFEKLWNRILQDNQKKILSSIFNADVSAGKISVAFRRGKNETIRMIFQRGKLTSVTLSFSFRLPLLSEYAAAPEREVGIAVGIVLQTMITRGFLDLDDFFDIIFLPTARTGFLLTYQALAKDAFIRYGVRNSYLPLTRPCTDFLANLTAISKNFFYDRYEMILDFIERNIIHGQILVSNETPLPEFSYRPEKTETDLPMFLSSDVIKEIAPLALTLKYLPTDALFIEEPEMSLHPKLQQMMARTLIKIANADTPVLAATHSDAIIQHVNNMIKLSALPQERRATLMNRYDFEPDDLISADNVAMYQFDVQENGRTAVRRLSCGAYGFEVPTFYEALKDLLDQTRATEPDAEEDED